MGRRGDGCAPCVLGSEEGAAVSTFCRTGWTFLGWMPLGWALPGWALLGSPWHRWLLLVTGGWRGAAAPGTPSHISGRSADAALLSPLFALHCLSWCVNKEGFVIKQRWLLGWTLGKPSPGPARTGGAMSVPSVSSLPYCSVENGSAP